MPTQFWWSRSAVYECYTVTQLYQYFFCCCLFSHTFFMLQRNTWDLKPCFQGLQQRSFARNSLWTGLITANTVHYCMFMISLAVNVIKCTLVSSHQTGLEVWLAYFSNSPGAVHSVPVYKKKTHMETNITKDKYEDVTLRSLRIWQKRVPCQPMPITAGWGESHLCWAKIQSCHQSSQQTQTLLRNRKKKGDKMIMQKIEGEIWREMYCMHVLLSVVKGRNGMKKYMLYRQCTDVENRISWAHSLSTEGRWPASAL